MDAPAEGRSAAAGGRAAGRRGDRLARARYRRRPGGPRLPARLAARASPPSSSASGVRTTSRGHPEGRLYPMTRDELVECAALLGVVRAGDLDASGRRWRPSTSSRSSSSPSVRRRTPRVARRPSSRRSSAGRRPTRGLGPEDFESTVALVTDGVVTGRGRRGAHLHRDRVNGVLRPRRGALLTAATSGGAIPELADYRVVLEPEETLVGTVNEDFAVEAMAGDVFLLGSAPGGSARVETGTVRVVDAEGAAPTRSRSGSARRPARTDELSEAVSSLAALVDERLGEAGRPRPGAGRRRSSRLAGVEPDVAEQVVAYLAAALRELGRAADDGPARRRALLRRRRRDAVRRPLAVRRAGQPRPRARLAQAVLPHLRLRAASGGERRRRRALARPAALVPARRRCLGFLSPETVARSSSRRSSRRRSSPPAGAGTSAAPSSPRASAGAATSRRRSSGWRPTT